MTASALPLALALALGGLGCRTVDLGDNFVPPEVNLDEDFFYCQIQPNVISTYHCAGGDSAFGEGAGDCHQSRSSLRLDPAAETDPPPTCDGNTVVGPVPISYQNNLENVRFTVGPDPDSSSFYRRPLNLDGHPRQVFMVGSPPADLIVEWITMGAM